MPYPVQHIRKLARQQRVMLWLLLASMAIQSAPLLILIAPPMPTPATAFAAAMIWLALCLGVQAVLIIAALRVLASLGTSAAGLMIAAAAMVAPLVNLVVLAVVNMDANRALRQAGLPVGLMGVRRKDLKRALDSNLCTGCSYDLTGNISGICPECGQPVQQRQPD